MAQNTVSVIIKGIDRVSHVVKDLEDRLKDLRDFPIDLDVGANLDRAQQAIDSLNGRDIHIDVNADTAMARAEIEALHAVRDIHIDVEANTAKARAKLEALRLVKDIHVPVEVDTAAARAEIEALRLVKDIHIPVEVDTKKALAEVVALKKALPDRHFIDVFLKANQARMAAAMEALKRNLPNEHFLNVRVDQNSAKAAADVKALLASLPDKHKITVDVDVDTLDVLQKRIADLKKNLDFKKFMEYDLFPEDNVRTLNMIRDIKTMKVELEDLTRQARDMASTDFSSGLRNALADARNFREEFNQVLDRLKYVQTVEIDLDVDRQHLFDSTQRAARAARDVADNELRRGNGLPLRLNLQHFASQVNDAVSIMDRLRDGVDKLPSISGKLLMAPALIPFISTAIGGIGTLSASVSAASGAIGLMAGGLISGFSAAGLGAVGFAAIAIPQISNIFKKSEELNKLQDELANTTDEERRCEILEEMAKLQGSLNDKQREGIEALKKFQDFWKEFSKPFEMHSVNIFISALELLESTLTAFQPAFMDTAHAIEGLMDSLNESLKAPDMQAFAEFVNATAGPAITLFGEAFGFAIRGILNMMTAFGPYALEMAEGFRNMMERFSEWSANLSESDGFQKFVEFAQTTGMTALDQLGEIFGNVFSAISDIIGAFMPHAEDLTGTFVDMSERFAEWAASLGENQSFQDFVAYAIDTVPRVVEFIAQFMGVLWNLLEALRPVGDFLLIVATNVAEFLNEVMNGNPVFASIVAAIGWFVLALMALATPILAAVGFIGTLINGVKLVLPAFSGIFSRLGPIVSSAFGLIGGIIRTAVAALFSPAGLIILAIIALAVLIYKYWDEIVAFLGKTWDGIVKAAKFVWDALTSYFDVVLNIIKALFTAIWETIKAYVMKKWDELKAGASAIFEALKKYFTAVLDGYKTIFTTAWDFIKKRITETWEGLKKAATIIWNALKTYFTTILDAYKILFTTIWNSIRDKVAAIWNGLKDTASAVFSAIRDALSKIWDSIKNTISNVWNGIKTTLSNTVDGIKTNVLGVFSSVRDKLSDIWNGLKETARSAWDGVANIIKGAINGIIKGVNAFTSVLSGIRINIPKVSVPGTDISLGGGSIGMPSIPKIPMLAKGGLVTNATMAVVGEGRHDEAVLPLNKQVYAQLAEGINEQSGNGSGINIHQTFNTQVDVHTIQRETKRAIRQSALQWGAH